MTAVQTMRDADLKHLWHPYTDINVFESSRYRARPLKSLLGILQAISRGYESCARTVILVSLSVCFALPLLSVSVA